MTPDEAKEALERLILIQRYIDAQTISYDKVVALRALKELVHAYQEAICQK